MKKIFCENCGRGYDCELLQFGRTINCACGARVGLAAKVKLSAGIELKFFADVMHARLARWLRAINVDTVWEQKIPDRELVRRALAEKRFILTQDKRLPEENRVGNVLLVKSQTAFDQFAETVAHFEIERPAELFLRCLMCNTLLRLATESEIAAHVPAKVFEQKQTFHFCPCCQKVYWEGSHAARMRRQIEDLFARDRR